MVYCNVINNVLNTNMPMIEFTLKVAILVSLKWAGFEEIVAGEGNTEGWY